MAAVGAFEAKTHLGELLDRVTTGEAITITRRGRAVARLVPVASEASAVSDAIAALKAMRTGSSLGDWKALRDEGRR